MLIRKRCCHAEFFWGILYLHEITHIAEILAEPLLLTWINFNPSMDKLSHDQYSVGRSYLSIPKLQHHCSLGLDK